MNKMLKVLEFIFQSFWHWVGTIIIILTISAGIAEIIRAFLKR